MDNYNYPIGADTKDAPWNQVDNSEKEIEVTISVTLSKTVTIKVSDYNFIGSGIDEDGNYFEDIDYSDCDFKSAVKDQIYLPQEAGYIIKKGIDNNEIPLNYNIIAKALGNWSVDDFEVIED